ncbi:MAG: arsenite efflux transporter metallochaperone ArsD [Candidatus Nanopelagicales bacterium]
MPNIHIYEPALCCSTGVCGEDVDQALVTFTADVAALQAAGARIERHNLANDPGAFAANDAVRRFLQIVGSDGLPLTLVDGVTVATGGYPERSELLRLAGLGGAETCCGGGLQVSTPADSTLLPLAEEPAASADCCGGACACSSSAADGAGCC